MTCSNLSVPLAALALLTQSGCLPRGRDAAPVPYYVTDLDREVSSRTAYGRPLDLLGPRAKRRFSLRVAGGGEGTMVMPAPDSESRPGGRAVPRAHAGGLIAAQIGPYVEVGFGAGAFIGASDSRGTPSELSGFALADIRVEVRGIFGPENWQVCPHIRLGGVQSEIAWRYYGNVASDDHSRQEAVDHIIEDWVWDAQIGVGVSFAWRMNDVAVLIGSLSADWVPYVRERVNTFDDEDNAKETPKTKLDGTATGLIGVEFALTDQLVARIAVGPGVFQPDGSTFAGFLANGALEFRL